MDTERQNEDVPPPIEVPIDKLSEDIIDALIEEFVLREGTDYGAQEVSLVKKKEQVRKQLERKDIRIVFDFVTATPTLVTMQEFKRLIPAI